MALICRKVTALCFSVVVVSVLGLSRAGSAQATVAVLYASTGAGCGTLSSLYTINPSTAAATLVGPITVGGNQVKHVTGLAVHPSSGTLYGFMNGQDDNCTDFGAGTLLTIDKATGVATVVGSLGAAAIQSPDMTFDPFGNLYAWAECDLTCSYVDDLVRLDTSTGTVADHIASPFSTSGTGIASDSLGRLYVKSGTGLVRINQFTGNTFAPVSLDASADNMLAFGPSDVAYTGARGSGASAFTLRTFNVSTGVTTTVGTNTVQKIAALAWDLGTVTAPDVADLSLDKTVDPPTVSDWFTNVTFTITVSNDGPDSATGVVVTDALPAGYSYVSDDGGGDYDSSTGVWTIGTIANASSAELNIVATVEPFGSHVNDAEVTDTTTYDDDSVPGSGEGDTFDTETPGSTLDPNVDAAASVVVGGTTKSTTTKKTFKVLVTNAGTAIFTVSTADLDVEVNGSTSTVTCGAKTVSIKPGKTKKFKCFFNPFARGITPGSNVTYTGTVDLPADGYPGNDTGTQTVVAV